MGVALLAHLVGLAGGAGQDQVASQVLSGFPAVEQVRIAGQLDVTVLGRGVGGHHHGRREAAQGRDDRRLVDVSQGDAGLGVLQHHHGLVHGLAVALEGQGPALGVQQAHADRRRQGALVRLARRRVDLLGQLQGQGAGGGVIGVLQVQTRRAGLFVPGEKVGQVLAADLGEAADEFLHRGGVAIPAVEIEIHAFAEQLRPDQGLEHADHLRALLVDGRGVEVVDLQIAGRAHRVGQRALVLGELAGAQGLHVLDPLDGLATHVAGEALVAEDGQAFLQAQLEPVAAGDPVAGPVVEVFVGDDALDPLIVQVGGRRRVGQQERRVEDVQPLVLHRPEIEVAHGDDHEQVEVVLAAECVLVPLHGALEGVHGVGGAVRHAGVDIDAQVDGPAAHGDQAVDQLVQLTGHQGEQVAGLGEGVVPDGEMTPARQVARLHQVAVGQQALEALGRLDAHRVTGEHVGAVGEPGDLAEALGLALGAEAAAGHVEAVERLVVLRIDLDLGRQLEGRRRVRDGQVFGVDHALGLGQFATVDGHRDRLQLLAVQDQGLSMVAIAPDRQPGLHPRRVRREIEGQVDRVDQIGGRAIVGEPDRLGRFGAHDLDLGHREPKGEGRDRWKVDPSTSLAASGGRMPPCDPQATPQDVKRAFELDQGGAVRLARSHGQGDPRDRLHQGDRHQ